MGFDTVEFRQNISQILEYDYGDFMRLANVYLNHLRNELIVLDDQYINRRLDRMQLYLQFKPNWDVDSTKARLANDTQYVDDLLHGHEQDWESANFSDHFQLRMP